MTFPWASRHHRAFVPNPDSTPRHAMLRTAAAAALGTMLTGALLASLAIAQTPAPAKPTAKPAVAPPVLKVPDAPKPVSAEAWLVMDHATGRVLAGENIDAKMEPASITKVMTSYVIAAELAAGRVKPDDAVTMTENAWRTGGAGTDGSYSGFPVNQTAPLLQMEQGMVIQSGNDAAIALAEHIAGSEEAFAQLMNEYGRRIGLKNSNFLNATGLPAENHYASAHDLALLGSAMIRDFPEQYAYNKIREFTVGPITQPNRNRLLWRDESVDGIKTGHTAGAGWCLLSSAQRGDQRLVAVVLKAANDDERMNDSMALLNWGFRFFETHRLYEPGASIAEHRVWKGETDSVRLGVNVPLLVSTARGRYGDLKPMMDVPKTLIGPIKKGQEIGTIKVMLDGKPVVEAPLVALDGVAEAGFFKRLWHEFLMWWESV